jgi:hypothetical protein
VSTPGDTPKRSRAVDRFLDVGIWLLFFALLIPAGVVGWALRGSTEKTVTVTVAQSAIKPAPIQAAPAFGADELDALPTDNWITNGGSLSNQRYSPLDQITTANVSKLRGVWRTQPARLGARGQVLGRVAAAGLQGHRLCPDRRGRRVRGRRRHREDPLGAQGEPEPEDQYRLLRLGIARRRAR